MSSSDQRPYQYTQGDLERYLSGKMSPAEMHRLEKAALDDPFLSEALEGMLDFSGPGRARDLQDLERRITSKAGQAAGSEGTAQTGDHRNIPGTTGDDSGVPGINQPDESRFRIPPAPFFRNRYFRVAAAIALLIGLGLATTWMINRGSSPAPGMASNNERLRVTDTMQAKASAPISGTADDTASAMALASLPDTVNGRDGISASRPVAAAAQKPDAKSTQDQSAQAGMATNDRDMAARKETPVDVSGKNIPAKKETEEIAAARQDPEKSLAAAGVAQPKDNRQQEAATAAPAKTRMKAPQPGTTEKMAGAYIFTGQVKDPGGKPLSFVNIRIRNSAASTYADAKGFYRILSGDSSLEIDLKAVGFQGRTMVLSAAQPNQLVLMQPAGVQEKNLKPKASSKEEMTRVDDDENKDDEKPEAEPTDGWGAYQYYLLNNIRIPADASRQKLHGTVEVSFLVADNGRMSDFRVEKSLSPSCDREAVRLLKEGPAWTLYNSEKPLRARLTVVF